MSTAEYWKNSTRVKYEYRYQYKYSMPAREALSLELIWCMVLGYPNLVTMFTSDSAIPWQWSPNSNTQQYDKPQYSIYSSMVRKSLKNSTHLSQIQGITFSCQFAKLYPEIN